VHDEGHWMEQWIAGSRDLAGTPHDIFIADG
jgi:hypothetical protein